MGGYHNVLARVLSRDPHNGARHSVIDLDHRFSTWYLCVAPVLVQDIHPVEFRISRLNLLFGPSVDHTKVNLDHIGLDQNRNFMVLRGQAVLKCLHGALQRACDA